MKVLLVCEYREGSFLETVYELNSFADKMKAEKVWFAVGSKNNLPEVDGKFYIADVDKYKEYNPEIHKKLIIDVAKKEGIDYVVLPHTSYGWDLAPRVAAALKVAQISEVIDISDDGFVVPACNQKLIRCVKPKTKQAVITIQTGAFAPQKGEKNIELLEVNLEDEEKSLEFLGYEEAEAKSVDLTKAEVIVSVGRGIGKADNIAAAEALAKVLKGELGASRPVVDAGWVDHSRQVGTTGQIVSPKVYIALGISGAIQHLAGMKKSEFVIAVNTDKDAPIAEAADILVVADATTFANALAETLK